MAATGSAAFAGMAAICDKVKLVEYFDEPDSLLVAICSAHRCTNLAKGFIGDTVPVCYKHGAPEQKRT